MNLGIFILLVIQTIYTYGFSIYANEDWNDLAVGDGNIHKKEQGLKLKFQLKGVTGQEKVTISIDGNEEEFVLTTQWQTFSYPRPSSGSFSVKFLNDKGPRDVNIRGHESQVADLLPDFASNKDWGCGTDNENERCTLLRNGQLAWNGKYTYTLKVSKKPLMTTSTPKTTTVLTTPTSTTTATTTEATTSTASTTTASPTSTTTTTAATSSPPTTALTTTGPGCIVEVGVYIGGGNNAPNGQDLGTSGQHECSSKCFSNPDCVAWTMRVTNNQCWLKTVYEGHTFDSDDWITGTKECGRTVSTTTTTPTKTTTTTATASSPTTTAATTTGSASGCPYPDSPPKGTYNCPAFNHGDLVDIDVVCYLICDNGQFAGSIVCMENGQFDKSDVNEDVCSEEPTTTSPKVTTTLPTPDGKCPYPGPPLPSATYNCPPYNEDDPFVDSGTACYLLCEDGTFAGSAVCTENGQFDESQLEKWKCYPATGPETTTISTVTTTELTTSSSASTTTTTPTKMTTRTATTSSPPTTTATTTGSAMCDGTWEFGVEYPGYDIRSCSRNKRSTPEACQRLCQSVSGCEGWEWGYDKDNCCVKSYLRNRATGVTGRVAGRRNSCKPGVANGTCITVGGNQQGSACVFPFKIGGVEYNECTYAGGYVTPWCPTKVDSSGNRVLGFWGDCPTDDPTNCFPETNKVTTVAGDTTTQQNSGCPSGWTFLTTGCYKLTNVGTHQEAVDNCQKDGGYLVEIDSQEENNALSPYYNEVAWLGATDIEREGEWVWSHSGRKVSFTNWQGGEPNGWTRENCLGFTLGHTGEWNDAACGWNLKGVCELDRDCPVGYTAKSGDVPGWGSLEGFITVSSREDCAKLCDQRIECHSFEHTYTSSICNLNKEKNPTSPLYYWYQQFCSKQDFGPISRADGSNL